MTPEEYNYRHCPAVNPPHIDSTDHLAAAASMLCVRDSGWRNFTGRVLVKCVPA